jgi:hypothetical protein
LLSEAVDITTQELAPQSEADFMLQMYHLPRDIPDAANVQVTGLSKFIQRNVDWKTLKYK